MEDEPAAGTIHLDDASRLARGVGLQDRFLRLHNRDNVAISAEVAVGQRRHFSQARVALLLRSAELDMGDFLEEPPQDLNAVAALGALAPRLDICAVVM